MALTRTSALVGLYLLYPSVSAATGPDELDVRLSMGPVVSNIDAGGELRLTFDLGRAVRLGLRGRGLVVRQTYIAGFEEDDGTAAEGLAFGSFRLARFGTAELRLRAGVGVRGAAVDTSRPDDATGRLLTELGPMVFWQPSATWSAWLGWIQVTDLELSPSTDIAVLGPLLRVGGAARLGGRWSAYAEAELGGVIGYGGDNEKVQVRGALGVRVALDEPSALEAPSPTQPAASVGAFVTLEWRAMAIGGHASHGPGLSAGVRLFDGALRIGLTGFARPGPFNPKTFDITPAGGATYRGQEQVSLRSDGGFFGLLLESELPWPGLPQLRIVPSVALGNAAFGFYLTGDDRETPDGRRVSAWEDELQDGKDAGVAFAIEPGVRVSWMPNGSFIGPYVAARYLVLVGYDAFALNNYDGFSAALGAEMQF